MTKYHMYLHSDGFYIEEKPRSSPMSVNDKLSLLISGSVILLVLIVAMYVPM